MFCLNMLFKGRYQLIKGYENNPVTVGFGSYGQVKLGKDKETGQTVAIKIINKLAKNQVIFHNKLSHPNIIQLLSYQVDRQRQITYMVLEYADDGTLFEKIRTNTLNKSLIQKYFKNICQAVAYLHSNQIMHRDIKPQNILLTKNKQAKLCDFGFAALLGERMTLCGTYQYMSPQMIQNKSYDCKIDIWALGILLFEMIAGQAPFKGDSPQQVITKMKTKIYFCQKFKNQQIALIKFILRVTPSKRPTIQQILSHPYFYQENISTKASQEQSKIKLISLHKIQHSNQPQNLIYKPIISYGYTLQSQAPRIQNYQSRNNWTFNLPSSHKQFPLNSNYYPKNFEGRYS